MSGVPQAASMLHLPVPNNTVLMPADKPEDVDAVDPTKLDGPELMAIHGDYTCDGCRVRYGHAGWKIIAWSDGGIGGYSRVAVLCKWCLIKLGISIIENQLG